jgi:hypothetical protein
MRADALARIERELPDEARVLDVGGWAAPLERADWVIDLLPHETRGLYGHTDPARERFRAETWVQRDICDREPWPFADDSFDFVACAQTLEDVRDPVFVCSEMARVARAGYLECPSWRAELTAGVNGAWTGYSHHRWLVRCDQERSAVEFVFKFGIVHVDPYRLPRVPLPESELQTWLWWEGSFAAGERIITEPTALDAEMRAFVAQHAPPPSRRRWPHRRRTSRTEPPGTQ